MKKNTLINLIILTVTSTIVGLALFTTGLVGFGIGCLFAALEARFAAALTGSKLAVPIAYLSMAAVGSIGWGFYNWPFILIAAVFAGMAFVSLVGKPVAPHTAK